MLTKEEILEMEYQNNVLVNENFTFDEFLDLYEERKTFNNIESFNNFIRLKLQQNGK
jgi:hypothetical protein